MSLVLALTGLPASAEEGSILATRAGTLSVVSEPDSESLKLGETVVFGGGHIALYGKYPIGTQDVVLVGDRCVICKAEKLSLVVLEPGKEPRVLSDDERFFSRDHKQQAALKEGRLEIDLGWDGGRRKRARYDGDRLSFLFEVAGFPAWVEGAGIDTRAGTVTWQVEKDEPPQVAVKLGKTKVYEGDYVTLYGKYPVGAQDVVLVGNKGGGTCCPYDQLSLLVLQSGKEPRVLSDKRFISVDGTQEAALKQGRLEVDLGFDGGKRKLARYDGKRLAIVFEDRARTPLTEEECTSVYDGMKECADRRPDDPHCKDPARFSGVIGRSVIPILQQPGLSQRSFTQACIAACKSGKVPPLDAAFRKAVCGIGK